MIGESHQEKHSSQSSTPTLRMRWAAGIWFGTLFGLLGLGYLIYQSRFYSDDPVRSTELFYFIIAPMLIAGCCGAFVGAGILAGHDPLPKTFAALRGMVVGVFCVAAFIVILAIIGTRKGARHGLGQFVWLLIYIGLFWGLTAAIPLISIGALSGLMLRFAASFRKKLT
jgi:hypothetical protein